MTRPGFVLDVDERTPPLVVPNGDTFRLERLPLGSKVVYPADSPEVPDLEEATAAALDAPLDSVPLAERLRPGATVTIVVDDNTVPVPPMRRPDVRAGVIETVLGRAARAGVDDVTVIVGTGLNRRMTPAELQRMLGERVFRSFFADGLLRNHDAENADQLREVDGASVNARVAESDLVIYVHVVADPRHSTGHELAAAVGSVATVGEPGALPSLPVFQIDVVLDNSTFPAALSFLGRREWEWSLKEQLAWRGIRGGLDVAPRRVRRRILNRGDATYAAIGVLAGDPATVSAASRTMIADALRVPVEDQVDVAVLGVGQHTPYSVDSPVNPILAAWQGLVGRLGSHTGRPLVREGGAVIAFHPMPNDFSPLHHPSYVDFFADVLPAVSDPDQVRADVEPKFAGDPWYAHLYRNSQAFHGVHPLHRWYEIAAARRRLGEVVWVGADRAVADRLGFRAASTLSDALEIVSFTVGRSPRIGYLHAPPNILVDVT
jgi:hypothetical protein